MVCPQLGATPKKSSKSSKTVAKKEVNDTPDFAIGDCLSAFTKENERSKNDIENRKREYLLTQLHLTTLNIPDKYKEVFEGLQAEWVKRFENLYGIDIRKKDVKFNIELTKKRYHYDMNISFVKNNNTLHRKLEFKYLKKINGLHDLPQFGDIYEKDIPDVAYAKHFFNYWLNKVVDAYNKHSLTDEVSLVIPDITEEQYVQFAQCANCANMNENFQNKDKIKLRDFLNKIKTLGESNTAFKKELDKIVHDSVNDYLNTADYSFNCDAIKNKVNEQKEKMFIVWCRDDKCFKDFVFSESLAESINSSLQDNKVTKKMGKDVITLNVEGDEQYCMNMRLRWKNGNGICNVGIQLSLKKNK